MRLLKSIFGGRRSRPAATPTAENADGGEADVSAENRALVAVMAEQADRHARERATFSLLVSAMLAKAGPMTLSSDLILTARRLSYVSRMNDDGSLTLDLVEG